MDNVPAMAAVAAAAQKSPHVEAIDLAASKAVSPVAPTALDPRPTYALTPGTADAMLSLADMKVQAVGAAEFEARYGHAAKATEAATAAVMAPVVAPEPAKVANASNRNWNEDVRLVTIPSRKVGSDTVVQYDTPQIMAAWSAAFPDTSARKYRGLSLADTDVKPETSRFLEEFAEPLLASSVFLICNAGNYKTFSETHPHTHINWIAVDSDEILLVWPKDAGEDKPHVVSASADDPKAAERDGSAHQPTAPEAQL